MGYISFMLGVIFGLASVVISMVVMSGLYGRWWK